MDTIKLLVVTHDLMFKALFACIARANAILRALLPPEVVLDLAGLPERVEASFVNEWLGATHADLVFRYKLKSGGWLYILLEHKHGWDRTAPAQILGYELSLWRTHGKRRNRKLVAPTGTVSLLLHNSPDRWKALPPISALIDGESAAWDYVRQRAPISSPDVVDMKEFPMARLAGAPEAWAGWSAMVWGGMGHISQEMLTAILTRLEEGSIFESQAIWYLQCHCDPEMVKTTVRAVMGKRGGDIMERITHPAYLRGRAEGEAKGIAKGRAKGRVEGRAKGEAEGKAKALAKQLRLKFRLKRLPPGLNARLAAAPPAQMDAWIAAVLTAPTLAEALAAKPRR